MNLNGKRVDAAPGVQLYRITQAHKDTTGKTWPKGTEYQPSAAWYDGTLRRYFQRVWIKGARIDGDVVFSWHESELICDECGAKWRSSTELRQCDICGYTGEALVCTSCRASRHYPEDCNCEHEGVEA